MESGVLDLGAEFLKDLSVNAIVQAFDLYLSQEGGGEKKIVHGSVILYDHCSFTQLYVS